MRIIAGEFRGRLLVEPRFDTTRPITDRAKQSLFDILSPILDDAVVYDCFCGTGSMGLECLSRGAQHAAFFDADRHALAGLKQNIETLGVQRRSKVVAGDIFRSFPPLQEQPKSGAQLPAPLPGERLGEGIERQFTWGKRLDAPSHHLTSPQGEGPEGVKTRSLDGHGVSLLFFDPPYPFLREKPAQLLDLMQRLLHHRLADNATILFRHDVADALIFPGTQQTDLRTYGGMAIEILRPLTAANKTPRNQ